MKELNKDFKIKNYMPCQQRFKFDEEALAVLNEAFRETPNPSLEIKRKLANRLNLPYNKVMVWFNNRRRGTRHSTSSNHERNYLTKETEDYCSTSSQPKHISKDTQPLKLRKLFIKQTAITNNDPNLLSGLDLKTPDMEPKKLSLVSQSKLPGISAQPQEPKKDIFCPNKLLHLEPDPFTNYQSTSGLIVRPSLLIPTVEVPPFANELANERKHISSGSYKLNSILNSKFNEKESRLPMEYSLSPHSKSNELEKSPLIL